MLTLPHEITPGLARENAAHLAMAPTQDPAALRAAYGDAAGFCRAFDASAEGVQFAAAIAALPAGARVADLGAGHGVQSVALARRGLRPTAVEPSPTLCAAIAGAAAAFGLEIAVVNATAEALDALPAGTHDAAVFSASLHHCDDPQRALRAVARLLKPGGELLVLNEPHLQRFRSKEWFAQRLSGGDCVAGDYGGNEHIYYRHEYRAMLRAAGFTDIRETLAARYVQPESYLSVVAANAGGASAAGRRRRYYAAVAALQRSRAFGALPLAALKALSLVQLNYAARKPG